ncbi:MAG TPA: cytochrome c [Candidatus Binataceae bacterium]|nr:cytochrome c [Candidatus Binataceae bacterium]
MDDYLLTAKPADLTQMAKQNGGTFPGVKVMRAIDGRDEVRADGTLYRIKWQLFLVASFVLCMALGITSTGSAQEGERPEMVPPGKVTMGSLEYRSHCAQCHGPEGKGDGPVAAVLTKKPADLTQITKSHAGTFPEEWLTKFIDGSDMVAAHGTRGMPIWGREFSKGSPGLAKRSQHEVDRKIKLLVDYIKSIQEE